MLARTLFRLQCGKTISIFVTYAKLDPAGPVNCKAISLIEIGEFSGMKFSNTSEHMVYLPVS